MTIQNQGIEEVKASFGVNAEVADAIDKKAASPGKVQKNGDQESESIPQGSSLPKTKISMINAVMSKLSQMKKEDVEQQLASMEEAELDEDELDEAHRRGGNRFLNTREKDSIQKKMKPLDPNAPVEYKDKYSITRGLPHEEQLKRHIHAATGHHVYISPFTHDMHPHDSKEVITKEVYNTGGKGTYGGPGGTKHTPNSLVQAVKKFHNKKLRAEEVEEIDETEEQIDEVKLADLPRRMVKGKSYGADYVDPEGADDADDMKKPEPKRKSGPQGTMKRRFIKDKSKLRMQYK